MNPQEKKLLRLFAALDEGERETVFAFVEFLGTRAERKPSALEPPRPIPRPEKETVVAAIKRLTTTYPMIDKSKVLHEASSLMAQHVMGGRDPVEVINEMERIFERHYRDLTDATS